MNKALKKINIFWTGGMDSTFRLVQLLMTTDFLVQPHYIVRSEDSTGIEIDSMIKIRRAISREYPELMPKLLPTLFTNEGNIPEYKDINKEIEALRKSIKIVAQYKIMLNYCKAFDIDQIEVAITSQFEFFEQFSNSHVFHSFIYPLKEITKPALYKIAKRDNWNHLLDMTSTCRRPIKKIKPCGICSTCVDMVMQGMGFTLPFTSRIKAHIEIPFRKYWRKNYPKHKDSKLFKYIQKKLEHKL